MRSNALGICNCMPKRNKSGIFASLSVVMCWLTMSSPFMLSVYVTVSSAFTDGISNTDVTLRQPSATVSVNCLSLISGCFHTRFFF